MVRRLLINIIILFIVLWIHPIVGFGLAFIYSLFQSYRCYEIIGIGIIIDIIHHTYFDIWLLSIPIYTSIGILLFVLGSRIQEKINFYV